MSLYTNFEVLILLSKLNIVMSLKISRYSLLLSNHRKILTHFLMHKIIIDMIF